MTVLMPTEKYHTVSLNASESILLHVFCSCTYSLVSYILRTAISSQYEEETVLLTNKEKGMCIMRRNLYIRIMSKLVSSKTKNSCCEITIA